jgi:hypothetical protein
MNYRLFAVLAFAAAAVTSMVAVGCKDAHSDDHGSTSSGGHTSPYPSCNEILEACHEVDVGAGPVHDCHDQAHEATSDAPCVPVKANCLKICGDAKADAGS